MLDVNLHSVLSSEHVVYVKKTRRFAKDGYRQFRMVLQLSFVEFLWGFYRLNECKMSYF